MHVIAFKEYIVSNTYVSGDFTELTIIPTDILGALLTTIKLIVHFAHDYTNAIETIRSCERSSDEFTGDVYNVYQYLTTTIGLQTFQINTSFMKNSNDCC